MPQQRSKCGCVPVAVKQVTGSRGRRVTSGTYSALSRASRSIARLRARRDITVPIGVPTMSAISRYDISSTSRSTITSRKVSGSAASSRQILSLQFTQHLDLESSVRLLPQRNRRFRIVRFRVHVVRQQARASSEFDAAHVVKNGEKPWLDIRTSKGVEMPQSAQVNSCTASSALVGSRSR